MFFTLLSWCEPNSPIRYPIRCQVRDRPTVGKKVYIQSDRLLCALCSSWHCFSVSLYTIASHVLSVLVGDQLVCNRSCETATVIRFREKETKGESSKLLLDVSLPLASLPGLIFLTILFLSRHDRVLPAAVYKAHKAHAYVDWHVRD